MICSIDFRLFASWFGGMVVHFIADRCQKQLLEWCFSLWISDSATLLTVCSWQPWHLHHNATEVSSLLILHVNSAANTFLYNKVVGILYLHVSAVFCLFLYTVPFVIITVFFYLSLDHTWPLCVAWGWESCRDHEEQPWCWWHLRPLVRLGWSEVEELSPLLLPVPPRKSSTMSSWSTVVGMTWGDPSSVSLVAAIKEDLHLLHLQNPGMRIIVSGITQRCRWKAGGSLKFKFN